MPRIFDNITQKLLTALKDTLVVSGHAEEFKNQLTYGAPTNEDEVGLRRLSEQIKSKFDSVYHIMVRSIRI